MPASGSPPTSGRSRSSSSTRCRATSTASCSGGRSADGAAAQGPAHRRGGVLHRRALLRPALRPARRRGDPHR
ncbi:MAG: hypothetical protein KDJ88_07390, partial [Bauldia sp.]|nr:hypothetical protein [Bauldia sp.]